MSTVLGTLRRFAPAFAAGALIATADALRRTPRQPSAKRP